MPYRFGRKRTSWLRRRLHYPQLHHHLKLAAMPPTPPVMDYHSKVGTWGVLLNDDLGDCAIAAPCHIEEVWSVYAPPPAGAPEGVPEFVPTDADIKAAYCAACGYVDGDSSTDNGCDMLQVAQYWHNTGIAGLQIDGFAEIDCSHGAMLDAALNLLGPVYAGLQFPNALQPTMFNPAYPWDVPPGQAPAGDWAANPEMGHAVCIVGRDQTKGIRYIMSWGMVFIVTDAFWNAFFDEAVALAARAWAPSGISPAGQNVAQLLDDLTIVKS